MADLQNDLLMQQSRQISDITMNVGKILSKIDSISENQEKITDTIRDEQTVMRTEIFRLKAERDTEVTGIKNNIAVLSAKVDDIILNGKLNNVKRTTIISIGGLIGAIAWSGLQPILQFIAKKYFGFL